jgi:hypothetical protein
MEERVRRSQRLVVGAGAVGSVPRETGSAGLVLLLRLAAAVAPAGCVG